MSESEFKKIIERQKWKSVKSKYEVSDKSPKSQFHNCKSEKIRFNSA